MLKKDLANLAKRAAKAKVHTLPEPKPLSKKDREAMAMPVMSEAYDDRPRLWLDDKEAPFLKDLKSGKDYTVVARIHVKELVETSTNGGKKEHRAELIITELLHVPESK